MSRSNSVSKIADVNGIGLAFQVEYGAVQVALAALVASFVTLLQAAHQSLLR